MDHALEPKLIEVYKCYRKKNSLKDKLSKSCNSVRDYDNSHNWELKCYNQHKKDLLNLHNLIRIEGISDKHEFKMEYFQLLEKYSKSHLIIYIRPIYLKNMLDNSIIGYLKNSLSNIKQLYKNLGMEITNPYYNEVYRSVHYIYTYCLNNPYTHQKKTKEELSDLMKDEFSNVFMNLHRMEIYFLKEEAAIKSFLEKIENLNKVQ